jgi:Flp pilus assembly protein TadG
MLLLGSIDYGWVFLWQTLLTNAAREGARAATTIFPGGCGSSSTVSSCASPGTATSGSGTSYGAVRACQALPSAFQTSAVSTSGSCSAVTINGVTWSQYTVTAQISSYKGLIGYVKLPSSLTGTSIMVGPQ